jgi:outer membrane protein
MGKRPKGYRWSLPLLMLAGLLGPAEKAPATEPLRWSVREAIGYALEHSPNVAVAQSKVDEKEEAKKVVFSNYLPDLTLDAGYKYLDNVPRIEFETAVDVPVPGLPPVRIQGAQEIGASDNYLARLSLNQLLFASGRVYYAYRAAGKQVESTRQEVETVKLGVGRQTAEAYLGVLISKAVADVQRKALATAKAHLEQVQNRHDAGVASLLELLRAQVEVSNVEPRVIEAEQNIAKARILLRRAAGMPDDVSIELTDTLEATVEPIDEAGELERARAMRPEFKMLEYNRSAAEDLALSERGGMLPRMQLTSSFGYEKPYFSIIEWEEVFTVGVGLQVPLFDGLESYRSMRRARATAETVKLAAVQTHADVRTQVHTAVLGLREAAVRMETTADNKGRAEQMLDISEHSYAAGAATNVEVIDAQLAATRARLEHLKALYDYRSAQIQLAAATGALTSIGR